MPNFKYKEGYYKFDPNDLFGHMQQEFPEESEFDVVIIGGGPNGLMAGAYLAKAGLEVCICERRYEAGGGLATEENLYPCFATNPHVLYHMMVDYMPVIRDFDLDGPALTWIRPNAQSGLIFEDGSTILLTRMVQDTKDSIKKYSFKDLAFEVSCTSKGLFAAGFEKGDRVIVLVPPGYNFFILGYALLQTGIIPAYIDPAIGLRNLKKCVLEVEPVGFIGITQAHVARVLLGWGRSTITKLLTIGPRLFWGGEKMINIQNFDRSEKNESL